MVNHQLIVGLALITSTAAFSAEFVVKFKKGSESFRRAVSQRSIGRATVKRNHPVGDLVLVEVNQRTKKEIAQVLSDLMKNPEVQYVVENFKLKAFDLPNDPDISKQWSVGKVNAAKAWKAGVGSRDIKVAVIDTGVDLAHSDLKDNLWINKKEIAGNGKDDDQNGYVDDVHGYDFFAKDGDPQDETSAQNPGHGTHCSGIIGAVGDNGKGISGMSQRVSIMAVRFLGADGSGDLMSAVEAIDYAVANGAQVISASWGAAVSASQAQPITEAIGRANEKNILFVAAAANDGKDNDRVEVYPANTPFPNVITVAASGSSDAKPTWSNYGKAKVSLASPGEEIYSTLPSEKYGNLSGTSMATPLVSGLSALILSHNSQLNPVEIKALLQASGTKVEIETACNCRVDAAAAVERTRSSALTIIPQALTLAPEGTAQFTAVGGKGPYTFSTSTDSIGLIDEKGFLTAKSEGEMTVSVTDSQGNKNESLKIRVAVPQTGGGEQECPLGDPALCQMMCVISPELPWCKT